MWVFFDWMIEMFLMLLIESDEDIVGVTLYESASGWQIRLKKVSDKSHAISA